MTTKLVIDAVIGMIIGSVAGAIFTPFVGVLTALSIVLVATLWS